MFDHFLDRKLKYNYNKERIIEKENNNNGKLYKKCDIYRLI